MTRSDHFHGVLLLNKPPGISSHDAVIRVRHIAGQRSVGHCGTLDPLAEGLLVLCFGRATKASRFLTECDKTYDAVVHLGLTSTTYDAEGLSPDAVANDVSSLNAERISRVLAQFEGAIRQKVPVFSAVRMHGKRLYTLARRGETVETPEREVIVRRIELLSYDEPYLHIRVECTKGTYIRTLAHGIGERLGCGAYLSHLKRIGIGHLRLEDALTLDEIAERAARGGLQECLLALDEVLRYGAVTVSEEFGRVVATGRQLCREDVVTVEGSFSAGDRILLKNGNGAVLAIGMAGVDSGGFNGDSDRQLFRYVRVLN
ncbi:MAG TPA: tRNA pseudouridine(55) synthase TruB [Acidobacteriota bacterium]|nr:tRNA pseudouridine(55) synthase TruB [Acidobacteriota bacterium]